MSGTHARLILLNMTTVEHMRVQDMKDHESSVLAETYSMCSFTQKRRAKARWDEEWGRPAIEGNIWWLGSGRKNWESVMGQSVWSWFRESRNSVVLPLPIYLLFYHSKSLSVRRRTTA
jgi:palmitoyltransferase